MQRILLCLLCLLLMCNIQACSKSTEPTRQSVVGIDSEAILKEYFAYIQKFDQADVGNMRPDITKPDKNQMDYQIIVQLLTEAEAVEQKMNAAATSGDVKAQLQMKPYLPIISARVAVLKSNKATYQTMGVQ